MDISFTETLLPWQRQLQQQIPFGNDNQKDKRKREQCSLSLRRSCLSKKQILRYA